MAERTLPTDAVAIAARDLIAARLLCMNASEAYHLEQRLVSWRLQRGMPGEGAALEQLLQSLTGEHG